MKFSTLKYSIKNFSSKCDQTAVCCGFNGEILKVENFTFCAVAICTVSRKCDLRTSPLLYITKYANFEKLLRKNFLFCRKWICKKKKRKRFIFYKIRYTNADLKIRQNLRVQMKIILRRFHISQTPFTVWDMRTWDMRKVSLQTFRNTRIC